MVGEMLGRGFGPIRHIPLPIEVPVLEGYPVNEFGFDHSRSLGCSEGAEDRGSVKHSFQNEPSIVHSIYGRKTAIRA